MIVIITNTDTDNCKSPVGMKREIDKITPTHAGQQKSCWKQTLVASHTLLWLNNAYTVNWIQSMLWLDRLSFFQPKQRVRYYKRLFSATFLLSCVCRRDPVDFTFSLWQVTCNYLYKQMRTQTFEKVQLWEVNWWDIARNSQKLRNQCTNQKALQTDTDYPTKFKVSKFCITSLVKQRTVVLWVLLHAWWDGGHVFMPTNSAKEHGTHKYDFLTICFIMAHVSSAIFRIDTKTHWQLQVHYTESELFVYFAANFS